MASIQKRTRADGSIVYKAQIVIKKDGVIVHRESKTFDKMKIAKDWGLRREVELQGKDVYKTPDYLPLRSVIESYLKEFEPEGKSKKREIDALLKRAICKIDIHKLDTGDLIKHIKQRNKECLPQTAGRDLIWLNIIVKTMKGVHNLDVDLSIFDSAKTVLKAEGLIASSAFRERRPTKGELWALSRYFFDKPYILHIIWFAIYSARRQSEITRLRWDDIKHDDRTCIIRDLKDPRKKGKTKRFKIPKSAYKIIMRQDKTSEFIFPYKAGTIGTYFTQACRALKIKDLHFHDLRHESISRFMESGLSIIQVQQISLHDSLSNLQRYNNSDPGLLDI